MKQAVRAKELVILLAAVIIFLVIAMTINALPLAVPIGWFSQLGSSGGQALDLKGLIEQIPGFPEICTEELCIDARDNDCDRLIDEPDCRMPQCSDKINNDYDNAVDYPDDMGCESPADDNELNPGAECDDGKDNDGDDAIDYPADSYCANSADKSESKYEEITPLKLCVSDDACDCGALCTAGGSIAFGSCARVAASEPSCRIAGDIDNDGVVTCADATCIMNKASGNALAPECINEDCMDVAPLGSTDGKVTVGDGVVALRMAKQNGYVCSNNQQDPAGMPSQSRQCIAKQCYDFIDNDADTLTDYPQDAGCENIFDDGEKYECSDRMDNDGDTKIDFTREDGGRGSRGGTGTTGDTRIGIDPGCYSSTDHSELGPAEMQCDNGIDDDNDGRTDFPDDENCNFPRDMTEEADCSDGTDNDADGNADYPADAECKGPGDPSELANCDDGIDNDKDGKTDEPDDAGCENAEDVTEHEQCDDDIDNDGDGFIDWPADRGCGSREDLNEKSQCSDGLDNDNDGTIDMGILGFGGAPPDPGCENADDDSEKGITICDNGIDDDRDGKTDYDVSYHTVVRGEQISNKDPGCNGPEGSKEDPQCNDRKDNDFDGLIDMLDPGCGHDYDDDEKGGTACDDGIDNDRDGKTDLEDTGCRNAFDNDENNYACNDNTDNDGDTYTDYKDDPGCSGLDDNDELPADLNMYKCDNGIDDDSDGLADYPKDPGCDSPADLYEVSNALPCDNGRDNDGDGRRDYRPGRTWADPGCNSLTDMSEYGVVQCDNGLDDDYDGRTDYLNGGAGDSGCTGPEDNMERTYRNWIECDDGKDNDFDGKTDYSGPDADGDPGCYSDDDDYEGTGFACDNWYIDQQGVFHLFDDDADGKADMDDQGCINAFDSDERLGSACDDSVDNDQDGSVDMLDEGCSSIYDSSESIGDMLPECDDGSDNDGDGLTDYGPFSTSDPGCETGSDDSEGTWAQCDDSIDNDADGFIDYNGQYNDGSWVDPGCDSMFDTSEKGGAELECDNGVDDDSDGFVDENDPSCSIGNIYNVYGTEKDIYFECDDDNDNDNDGFIDYPSDPECQGPSDTSEGVFEQPCDNDVLNPENGETDIDCGGTVCPKCDIYKMCDVNPDCRSDVCDALQHVCKPAPLHCKNRVRDADETGVNCGGADCSRCGIFDDCEDASDCEPGMVCIYDGFFQETKCFPQHCGNNDINPEYGESDKDCGGFSCPKCADGKMCYVCSDCQSVFCNPFTARCERRQSP